MIFKSILILTLAALLIKILILKSKNTELFRLWTSENYSTKNIGLSDKEKKVFSLTKKLILLFFITFVILFLTFANSVLGKN